MNGAEVCLLRKKEFLNLLCWPRKAMKARVYGILSGMVKLFDFEEQHSTDTDLRIGNKPVTDIDEMNSDPNEGAYGQITGKRLF